MVMDRRICIVHRERRDLFEELSREFRDTPDVEIIFDRRIGERRRARVATSDNRRRFDRRAYHTDIRLLGWMLTRQRNAGAMPLSEARPA